MITTLLPTEDINLAEFKARKGEPKECNDDTIAQALINGSRATFKSAYDGNYIYTYRGSDAVRRGIDSSGKESFEKKTISSLSDLYSDTGWTVHETA